MSGNASGNVLSYSIQRILARNFRYFGFENTKTPCSIVVA